MKRFWGDIYNALDTITRIPGEGVGSLVNFFEDQVASGKLINEELPINHLSLK